MSKYLLDYKNQTISAEDIVKKENMLTKEIVLFKYVSISNVRGVLYVLGENKEISDNNKSNINIDNGVSLLSNEIFRWSKIVNH